MNGKDFENGELRIRFVESGARATMTWTGRSNDRNPGARLNPYLDHVAKALSAREMTVAFEKLDYMNSSTVPPIIRLMKALDGAGVRTTLTYDASSDWQRASFRALETLCKMMKHVNVRGQ